MFQTGCWCLKIVRVVIIFHAIADPPYLLSCKLVTEEMSQSEIGPYVDAALTGSATQASAAALTLLVVMSVRSLLFPKIALSQWGSVGVSGGQKCEGSM